jgi:hypothetical protein
MREGVALAVREYESREFTLNDPATGETIIKPAGAPFPPIKPSPSVIE